MIYLVICNKCDFEQEIDIPMIQDTIPDCPECQGKRRKRITSPPSVQYKGTGFASTDKNLPDTDKTGRIKDVWNGDTY